MRSRRRFGSATQRPGQTQFDVYGEVIDALCLARSAGLDPDANAWRLQRVLVDFLAANWEKPDNGIWEVRGARGTSRIRR